MIPIPIGDAPHDVGRRPWVTWCLLALNVLAFVLVRAGLSAGERGAAWDDTAWDGAAWRWGFLPVDARIETYVTYLFLHGDWLHLGGNMLFLWVFGDNVEGRLGHVGYLCAYLACGVAAALLFQVLDPTGTLPLVGASGAVFGVLGFYFVAFPRNRVRILLWSFIVWFFWVPARVVLGLFFLLDLLLLLFGGRAGLPAETSSVAYAAHVGGFLCGLLLALSVARFPSQERPAAARTRGSPQRRDP